MSEKLPYETQLQQQWLDLPLPDENRAWADMKRRLDEDDDDGVIVWWRSGCVVWGLLLLLLIAMGWWFIKYQQRTSHQKENRLSVVQKTDSIINQEKIYNDKTGIIQNSNDSNSDYVRDGRNSSLPESGKTQLPGQQEINVQGPIDAGVNDKKIVLPAGKGNTRKENVPGLVNGVMRENKEISTATSRSSTDQKPSTLSDSISRSSFSVQKDSTAKLFDKASPPVDDSGTVNKGQDSLKRVAKTSEGEKKENKTDNTGNKKFFFSAGIAMQQQLPIDGQKAVSYNSLGRKGTLSDYIPSVYFRYNKEKKWFIQSEFRYGAPQYTKELLYANPVKLDTSGTTSYLSTTLQKVRKTYYHQLSATFNYYPVPQWSVGGGVIWNKFMSAIVEREVHRRVNGSLIDSLVSPATTFKVSDSGSSVFSKSYFQALFETQYQWRRFSLGARYSFGLQPYIRFTLTGGNEQKEKNSSIQVFLRYELWRSKSK